MKIFLLPSSSAEMKKVICDEKSVSELLICQSNFDFLCTNFVD